MNGYLILGSDLLKNWDKSMDDIKKEKDLARYIIGSLILIFIFGAIFGAVLGLFVGPVQIVLDAIKIPILFILSSLISLPVYYVMDALTGGKKGLGQIAALMLSATALATIILVGFVPILLLFILTTNHYATIVMLTVVICGIGGFYGILALLSGYKYIHDDKNWQSSMVIGGITYMFAGTQLSWVLRPYLNPYEQFIRMPRGNFYVAMFEFMRAEPDISSLFMAFLVLAIIIGVIFVVIKQVSTGNAPVTQQQQKPPPQDIPNNNAPQEANRPPPVISAHGR